MAIKTDKVIFYHIPRTGGIWVKVAMNYAGLEYDRCYHIKGKAQPWGMRREHATPDLIRSDDKKDRLSFCFVRHPQTWYQSFWCFRKRTSSFDKEFPGDWLWDDCFNKFMSNILDAYPEGFLTRMYQVFLGENLDRVDIIGRQEKLVPDLISILTQAGEEFLPQKIRNVRRQNKAACIPKCGDLARYKTSIRKQVALTESWIIRNFY